MIDGRPADEAPAWAVTFIQPGRDNERLLAGPGTGDVAPHAVALGENVVPQSWTITMISDTGDFQLTGSVTGDDGQGNALEPFTSNSKQIMIDPAMWRHTRIDKRSGDPVYGNARGDTFTFDVRRKVQRCVTFDTAGTSEALNTPDNDGLFTETLAQQLPNGPHTVQLIVAGDADGQPDSGLPGGADPAGVVVVDSLYVFQPPLK
jgi:hypothetical protein